MFLTVHNRWESGEEGHGTSFTKKRRQSASGEGRKPPDIRPGATTIVAPRLVGSRTTNGQMRAIS
jgi:hypothetical protein